MEEGNQKGDIIRQNPTSRRSISLASLCLTSVQRKTFPDLVKPLADRHSHPFSPFSPFSPDFRVRAQLSVTITNLDFVMCVMHGEFGVVWRGRQPSVLWKLVDDTEGVVQSP